MNKRIIVIYLAILFIISVIISFVLIGSFFSNEISFKNSQACLSFESSNIKYNTSYNTCECWENSINYARGKELKESLKEFVYDINKECILE